MPSAVRAVSTRVGSYSDGDCTRPAISAASATSRSRMLVEVTLRGGFDAVALIPVVDLVQVHLQDLVLGEFFVQLIGQDDLARLAGEGDLLALLGREDHVADELLGDGRGPGLAGAAAGQERRTESRTQVDAAMLVKERVLGCQRRVDQVLGDFAQGNHRALAAIGVVELPQELALTVKDLRRLEAGVVADLAERGQVAGEHGVAGGGALQQDKDADQPNADHGHEQARADHQRHLELASRGDALAVLPGGLELVQPLQPFLSAQLGAASNIQALEVAVPMSTVAVAVAVRVAVPLHALPYTWLIAAKRTDDATRPARPPASLSLAPSRRSGSVRRPVSARQGRAVYVPASLRSLG